MKKKKGVTLIELIVSMIIFGVVVAGVAAFNARNTKVAVRSERNAQRIILEESTIEEFKGWLKSASVPGSRFDGIWTDSTVGDSLFVKTDPETDISVRLKLDSKLPHDSFSVSDIGVRLRINVISIDPDLNINDTSVTFVSRHD